MYMQDGKQIQAPYGRKNPGISKIEFDEVLQQLAALTNRVALLESKQAPAEKVGKKPKEAIE